MSGKNSSWSSNLKICSYECREKVDSDEYARYHLLNYYLLSRNWGYGIYMLNGKFFCFAAGERHRWER